MPNLASLLFFYSSMVQSLLRACVVVLKLWGLGVGMMAFSCIDGFLFDACCKNHCLVYVASFP